MSDWLNGYFNNSWLNLSRYDPLSGIFKYGNTYLKSITTVNNWEELQAIPKTATNNDLLVLVKSFPLEKQLMKYNHIDGLWKSVNANKKLTSNSIMWVGSGYVSFYPGSSGINPNMIARKLYYTVNSWTNLTSFIRGFRASNGNSTTGSGTLAFSKANKTLAWKAPGDTTGGPNNDGFGVPVNVATGGWFRLEAATPDKEVCVAVKQANEPAADASDTVSFSGNTPSMITNLATAAGMFNAKYGNPFGDKQYFYAMTTLDVPQFWACRDQWQGVETDITWLEILDTSSRSTVSAVDTTLTSLLDIIKLRQAIGSHVIVATPIPYNAGTDATITYLPYLTRKLKSLAELHNFDVVDINRYLIDPAGTISDPMLASTYLSTDNNQYLSVRGAQIYEKYGLTPALSKYLPIKSKDEPVFTSYSTTEMFGNLLTNGKLTGTAGAKNDARVTGDVPTSMSAAVTTTGGHTMTAVCTSPNSAAPVARGDGLPGNVFQAVLNNVAVDGESFTLVQTSAISTSNYAAGDTVQFSGEMQISAGGNGIQLFAIILSGTGMTVSITSNTTGNIPGTLNGENLVFKFITQPVVLPSGIGSLNIKFQVDMKAGGNATIKISPNLSVHKVIH